MTKKHDILVAVKKGMLVRILKSPQNYDIIVEFKAALTVKSCFPPVSISTFGITYIENISSEAILARAILTH